MKNRILITSVATLSGQVCICVGLVLALCFVIFVHGV